MTNRSRCATIERTEIQHRMIRHERYAMIMRPPHPRGTDQILRAVDVVHRILVIHHHQDFSAQRSTNLDRLHRIRPRLAGGNAHFERSRDTVHEIVRVLFQPDAGKPRTIQFASGKERDVRLDRIRKLDALVWRWNARTATHTAQTAARVKRHVHVRTEETRAAVLRVHVDRAAHRDVRPRLCHIAFEPQVVAGDCTGRDAGRILRIRPDLLARVHVLRSQRAVLAGRKNGNQSRRRQNAENQPNPVVAPCCLDTARHCILPSHMLRATAIGALHSGERGSPGVFSSRGGGGANGNGSDHRCGREGHRERIET